MKIWYDCEFLERGSAFPIDLISIGMVREDGAELYLVNADCDWVAVASNAWLCNNVLPSLPIRTRGNGDTEPWWLEIDRSDPRVHPREAVAVQVKQFLSEAVPNLELWAWYADYDHVVLSQLFGRMIDLPEFMPMYTRDLKQEVDRLGIRLVEDAIRASVGAEDSHDALADAKYAKGIADTVRFLSQLNRRETNV